MSHPEQRLFCRQVRKKFPQSFRRVIVADVGSLDINGSNRRLFRRSTYFGIDVFAGKNVDVVGPAHKVLPALALDMRDAVSQLKFDTIISTEALEHDMYLVETLLAMYENLTSGGLLLITAAGDGRPEHGTTKVRPQDSPGTNDYYKNVSNEMFAAVLPPKLFKTYYLNQDPANNDMQFYGIKI